VAVTGADQRLDLFSALEGWLDRGVAVVPRTYLYPPDVSAEQIAEENAGQMVSSQRHAVAAALRLVGEDVASVVASVEEGAPAEGRLRKGDVILQVDGTDVGLPDDVVALVRDREVGDQVTLTVRRDGRRADITVRTRARPDDPSIPSVGVGVDYRFPFEVTINLGQDIGGPSAGLMFALAVVDKLRPGHLTDGRHIAGTGSITAQGEVEPVGGIQQKVTGAQRRGAEIFLTPADNCAQAVEADVEDIRLIRVESLTDAVRALKALEDDRDAALPACHAA